MNLHCDLQIANVKCTTSISITILKNLRIANNAKNIFLWYELKNELENYPTPVGLTYAWSFGSVVGIFFIDQVASGVILAMYYNVFGLEVFNSIIYIMHQVNFGWLLRYVHMNGSSMIFIFLFLHLGKSLYYQSFLQKRIGIWYSGILILLLMMATAFIGYVLPWGQMSFWGATVITNFVTAIPFIGEKVCLWIWGGHAVTPITLNRFYSLHFFLPFIIFAIIFLHLILLHQAGSSNSLQITNTDNVRFTEYFAIKDFFIIVFCITFFLILVFFVPNYLGHPDNWVKANPLITPQHIVPEWYFTAFYAILRTCSSKLGGVISMGLALLILIFLPLNSYFRTSLQISFHFSKWYRLIFWIMISVFSLLIYFGTQPALEPFIILSCIFTLVYFGYIVVNVLNGLYIFEKYLKYYKKSLFTKKKRLF